MVLWMKQLFAVPPALFLIYLPGNALGKVMDCGLSIWAPSIPHGRPR